ncbi:MAG TPA: VIT domain-containing protein, partial [Kofleriaceae bacterium]|nr:VIT domain-containing protein [Kofleriaceae bacterium]
IVGPAGPGGATRVDGDLLVERGERGLASVATALVPERADWSLAIERVADGAGVGRLDAAGVDGAADEALALRRVSIKVTTAGDYAQTEIEHVFYNPSSTVREGTFRFPVPDRAIVTGLAMEIDGKLMEGEIVEKEQAREIYDKIVDKMMDPALLEWEEGSWFKLRVFPLEPGAEKRVIIRYQAPLAKTAGGLAYDFSVVRPHPEGAAATTTATVAPIDDLAITIDGTPRLHETALASDLDVSLPIAGTPPPVVREVRDDGTYLAVRVSPQALLAGTPAPRTGDRKVAVIVDTSRSSLESRELELSLLKTTLGALGPRDQFAILAADVEVTPEGHGFVTASEASIGAAAAFIDGIEPDGATDVGAALAAAAALHPTDVIYVGDGIPSWGVRDPQKLAEAAAAVGAPIDAALVGKGASTELWSSLTGASGGRAMIVRRAIDADRFALAATHLDGVRRLRNAHITAASGVVYPTTTTTLLEGDELTALIHSPAGEAPPTSVTLVGDVDGKVVSQEVQLAAATDVKGVAQRWAVYQLAAMEAADAPREDLVKASQELGVLSRATSLLVLESDEAYKEYKIERRKAEEAEKLAAATPTVTGGDLDSLGAPQASLSPEEVQPGDPEIKIPAPIDARQVLVSFPWGESKVAVWDREVGAWMVRFLIDKDTPDGTYQVRVAVTHADGHVEVLALPFTVDTRPPAVALTAKAIEGGYLIEAKQVPGGGARRKDADKVEVALPDGTILTLAQTARGKFSGTWTTAPLASAVTLRVVVRDHALNQSVTSLAIAP